MSDDQAAARGFQAQMCQEFLGPIIDDIRKGYAERITDIAIKELDAKVRTDKITCLATGIRILEQIEGGLKAIVADGEIAKRNMISVERIESMTPAKRRLLNIGR